MAGFGFYGRESRPNPSTPATSFEYGHGGADADYYPDAPTRPLLDLPPRRSPNRDRRRSPSPRMGDRRHDRYSRYDDQPKRPSLLKTPPAPPRDSYDVDDRSRGGEFDFPADRRRARSRSPNVRSSGYNDFDLPPPHSNRAYPPQPPSLHSNNRANFEVDQRRDKHGQAPRRFDTPQQDPYNIDLESQDFNCRDRSRGSSYSKGNSQNRFNNAYGDEYDHDDVIEVPNDPPSHHRPPLLSEPDLYILPSERSGSRSGRRTPPGTRPLLPDPEIPFPNAGFPPNQPLSPNHGRGGRSETFQSVYQYPDDMGIHQDTQHASRQLPLPKPLLGMEPSPANNFPQKSVQDILGDFDVPISARQDLHTQIQMEQTLYQSQQLLNVLEQQDKAKDHKMATLKDEFRNQELRSLGLEINPDKQANRRGEPELDPARKRQIDEELSRLGIGGKQPRLNQPRGSGGLLPTPSDNRPGLLPNPHDESRGSGEWLLPTPPGTRMDHKTRPNKWESSESYDRRGNRDDRQNISHNKWDDRGSYNDRRSRSTDRAPASHSRQKREQMEVSAWKQQQQQLEFMESNAAAGPDNSDGKSQEAQILIDATITTPSYGGLPSDLAEKLPFKARSRASNWTNSTPAFDSSQFKDLLTCGEYAKLIIYDKVLESCHCYICDVSFITKKNYKDHVNGSSHANKLLSVDLPHGVEVNKERIKTIKRLATMRSIYKMDKNNNNNFAINPELVGRNDFHFVCRVCEDVYQGPVEKHFVTESHKRTEKEYSLCLSCNIYFSDNKKRKRHCQRTLHAKILKAKKYPKYISNSPSANQPNTKEEKLSTTSNVKSTESKAKDLTKSTSSNSTPSSTNKSNSAGTSFTSRTSGIRSMTSDKNGSARSSYNSPSSKEKTNNTKTQNQSSTAAKTANKTNSDAKTTSLTKGKQAPTATTKPKDAKQVSTSQSGSNSSARKEEKQQVPQGSGKALVKAITGQQSREVKQEGHASQDGVEIVADFIAQIPTILEANPDWKGEARGMGFLSQVAGFFCKVCSRFFNELKSTREQHCRRLEHQLNIKAFKLKQNPKKALGGWMQTLPSATLKAAGDSRKQHLPSATRKTAEDRKPNLPSATSKTAGDSWKQNSPTATPKTAGDIKKQNLPSATPKTERDSHEIRTLQIPPTSPSAADRDNHDVIDLTEDMESDEEPMSSIAGMEVETSEWFDGDLLLEEV